MKKNILFYMLLFLSAIAFCTGAFYEANIQGSGKTQLIGLLSNYYVAENFPNLLTLFLSKLKKVFSTWLVIFLSPLIPPFVVLGPLLSISKGLSLGFSATMIVESFGYNSIWYIALSILPQVILQLPLFCLLAVFSIDLSTYTFKFYTQKPQRKKNKNALLIAARHYALVYILGLVCLVICCLIEVFLTQFLL